MDKELIEKIAIGSKPYLWKFTDEYKFAALILALIRSAGYVQQWGKCPACHSDGKDHYLLRCDGKGIIRNVDHCPTCNGTGQGENLLLTREEVDKIKSDLKSNLLNRYTVLINEFAKNIGEEHLTEIRGILREIEDNSQFVVVDLHDMQRELRISESRWQSFKERWER